MTWELIYFTGVPKSDAALLPGAGRRRVRHADVRAGSVQMSARPMMLGKPAVVLSQARVD